MFRNKFSVVVHERTHTGVAPFSCGLCGIDFKRKHHLDGHLSSKSHKARQARSNDATATANSDLSAVIIDQIDAMDKSAFGDQALFTVTDDIQQGDIFLAVENEEEEEAYRNTFEIV